MKKISFLFILTLLSTLTASAYDAEIDGIYYNLVTKAKQAEVTSGKTTYAGNVSIPATVTYEGVSYSVTTIGKNAFAVCKGLTSVTIPNSVTSIGESAFSDCSGLTSVTIPNSVTSIGESAFSDCSGLTSVTIPNSVTSIGEKAFDGCKELASISIPNTVTSIGRDIFKGTAWYDNQPDGIVYVGKVAYIYKGTIPKNTSITLKEGTLSIADRAFYKCSGLTSVTIPGSVTTIGDYVFYGCSDLTSVTIPNSVTSIGRSAFDGCI